MHQPLGVCVGGTGPLFCLPIHPPIHPLKNIYLLDAGEAGETFTGCVQTMAQMVI